MIPVSPPLPPVQALVVHWNIYSYDALENRLEAEKLPIQQLPVRSRFRAYQLGEILFVHPLLRCSNHGVSDLPRQCIRLIEDLYQQHRPERLLTLQTGGIPVPGTAKINSLYRITQIQFQSSCFPVKGTGTDGPPPAMMLYDLGWLSSGLEQPVCSQRPVLLSSNSLSIPWLQRKGVIDSSTRVEILIAVTDVDAQDAEQSHSQYESNKQLAADALVSLLWNQLDL
ncbi:hypothetical protein [Synechococcus sp. UW179A]|uniref:hypothetical protein n=1 Tax=Synechococcus sp. UW179A TaxID=2575510 RepID=UPI0010BE5C44|nr:hypothetical protein [Synechococcus sp. UW179A]